MIISHLMGGLGNQMFEYAAGLAIAHKHRTILKLDTSFYHQHEVDDRHYSLNCLNINELFATSNEVWKFNGGITRMEKIARYACKAAGLHQWANQLTPTGSAHYQPTWEYYPEFEEITDNSWLHGNYQSEKFFRSISGILRHHFTFRYPATERVLAMQESIKQAPSVAIHFRRGDYVTNENFARGIGVLDFGYYNNAIRKLKSLLPAETRYYLFSDNIQDIKREYTPDVPHEFVDIFDEHNYYDKIRLMSSCDHNIIANSTFSWWAAWLNSNPKKIVIAPLQWYADNHHSSEDLIPQSWERL
ncbi:MAG: alpha-1,2-fucosyltransferase [Verrucomicrobiota bacterium]